MPDNTVKEAYLMLVAVCTSHNTHSITTENLQTYEDLEEDLIRIRQLKSSYVVHNVLSTIGVNRTSCTEV